MRYGRGIVAVLFVIVGGVPASVALAAPGELDHSFGDGGKVRTPIDNVSFAYAIGRQASGKLIVAGCSARSEPGSQAFRFTIARYTASGILDSSFGENGVKILSFPNDLGTSCVEDLAIRPDDSIVLAGRAGSGHAQDFAIAQLTPDGQLDNNFGTEGRVTLHPGNTEKYAWASAITLDPTGRAVIAGNGWTDYGDSNKRDAPSFAAVRIAPGGALDTSFGEDGEVILGMQETNNPEPGSGIGSGVTDIVRYTDGRIGLVGTAFDNWQDGNHQLLGRVAIARLTSGGKLDSSFSGDGKLVSPIHSVNESALFNAAALTPDGRITVGGAINHQALVARFEQNGEPDLTFGSTGNTLLADLGGCCETGVQALHYQADGKLIAAGISDPPGEFHPRFGVVRLDAQGDPDPGFGASGVVSGPPFEGTLGEPWGGGSGTAYAYDFVLEPSGDIVAAGAASSGLFGDGSTHFALARYQGSPLPPSDNDGDGFLDELDQCPDVPGVSPNGCPSSLASPSPTPSSPRHFEVRAIGDSVTAGFGYDASGKMVGVEHLVPICALLGQTSSDHCQSPDVIAYPAVWTRKVGVPLRYPSFANYAKSGSTPKDWVEPHAKFRGDLDRVVEDDPDVILLTLGGNPLLTDFAFGLLGQVCMQEITGELTRLCVEHKLAKYKTVPRLRQIYIRLLDAPNATVGVFLYHKTYPRSISYRKVDILFSELNSAIASAFTKTRRQRVGDANRLKLLSPPPFDGHQCGSPQSWVLSTDTCIHPNAAGQRAYARVITSGLFPNGLP